MKVWVPVSVLPVLDDVAARSRSAPVSLIIATTDGLVVISMMTV